MYTLHTCERCDGILIFVSNAWPKELVAFLFLICTCMHMLTHIIRELYELYISWTMINIFVRHDSFESTVLGPSHQRLAEDAALSAATQKRQGDCDAWVGEALGHRIRSHHGKVWLTSRMPHVIESWCTCCFKLSIIWPISNFQSYISF